MNKRKKYRHRRSAVRIIGIRLFNILFRHVKVESNKIFFINFSNRYECNPKYICEEFLKQNDSFKLVFATSKHIDSTNMFPCGVEVVKRGTKEFYKHLYSSKVIIDNDVTLAFLGFKKKKNQIVFETWHGSIGIKKFGRDANDDKLWHKMADKSAAMTDYIISGSKFETALYKETFWPNTQVLEFGHPRNDIFFKQETEIECLKNKIYELYSINKQNKLCLYAPTFRDVLNCKAYQMDFITLRQALHDKFGGNWTILFRFHTGTSKHEYELPKDVIDVSDYPDIQEVAAVISVGITDYSSWICEYLLRKKPGFIFANDADEYISNERKLTIPLEQLPFPLAKNNFELLQNISTFDRMIYEQNCVEFLKKHGSLDDGNASYKTVSFIKKVLEAEHE